MFDHVCKWYSVSIIQLYNIVFGTTLVAVYVLLGHILSWVLMRYHRLLPSLGSCNIGTTSSLSLVIEVSTLAHQLSSRYASSSYLRGANVCLAGYECRHSVYSFVLSFPGALLTCNQVCLFTRSLITSSILRTRWHWTILNKIITCRRSEGRSSNSCGLAAITNGSGAHIPHYSGYSDHDWYSRNYVKKYQWTSR